MESWVHVEPISGNGDDTVSITVDTNDSSEERRTTINVATSTLNKILQIIQKGKTDMNFNLLSIRKSPGGDITAYLNGSKKNAQEVQQILNTLANTPCLIVYAKYNTGGGMQFLMADSVTTAPKQVAKNATIAFPQNTSLVITSTEITES